MWTKKADEVKLESIDWTDLIGTDTISEDPTYEVSDSLSCTIEQMDFDTDRSIVKLTGGVAGESGYITATVRTTGGQILKPQRKMEIVKYPTVVG